MSSKFPGRVILSLILLLVIGMGVLDSGQARGSDISAFANHQEPESEGQLFFLPLIRKSSTVVYGVETYDFTDWNMNNVAQANIRWVRGPVISWASVEPVRNNSNPTYLWNQVPESAFINAANNGLRVIAMVKYTPSWAQKNPPGRMCGPIARDKLDEFAQFIYAAVSRYSVPPYNVLYWEFGNEPDVAQQHPPEYDFYGCWGDTQDPYFGGGYYAEMLKYAYPAVKAANPNARVLNGGLLLDCDPTNPPPNKDCLPAHFLEGMLRNGGGDYFDILSFHGYAYYYLNHIYDEDHVSFKARGGQITGKADFLRSVMAAYGVSKPLLMTEIALACTDPDCKTPSAKFRDLQADYIVTAFIRTWGLGMLGSIWYSMEETGWKQTGLFEGLMPLPSYNALTFLTNELYGARIGAQITQYPGLKGYQFSLPTKKVWVLWAPDGVTPVQIPRPANVTKAYTKFGVAIEPIPDPMSIVHPTYLEFPP